jgi:hypothetical protein
MKSFETIKMSLGANDEELLLLVIVGADQDGHEESLSADLNRNIKSTRYGKFFTFIVVMAALFCSAMYLSSPVRGKYSRALNVGPDITALTRKCAVLSKQCGGGKNWGGPTCCEAGSYCKNKNKDYSQCVESTVLPTCKPTSAPTAVPSSTPTTTPTSPPTTVPTTSPTAAPSLPATQFRITQVTYIYTYTKHIHVKSIQPIYQGCF